MKRKFLAALLAFAMSIGMIPTSSMAEEDNAPIQGENDTEVGSQDSTEIEVKDNIEFMNALTNLSDHDTVIIKLAAPITLETTDDWNLNKAATVTIQGNGNSITIPNGGKGLTVSSRGAILNLGLADGTDTLIVQAAKDATLTGALVTVDANDDKGGTLNMYDGVTLQNNHYNVTATDVYKKGKGGGGVEISRYTAQNVDGTIATFNMYGGTIQNNTVNYTGKAAGLSPGGGGVRVEWRSSLGGSASKTALAFNMYGGTITGNTASTTGQSAAYGGGVYLIYATFNFYGGAIDANLVDGTAHERAYGGGISCEWSKVYMGPQSGLVDNEDTIRSVSNNKMQCTTQTNMASHGIGLYMLNNGEPILKNVTISNNKTVNKEYTNYMLRGGGIYLGDYTPTVENCTIYNNWAGIGGGICLANVKGLTMTGCILDHNYGRYGGGGVYYYNTNSSPGTVDRISDTRIINNYPASGAGIYFDRFTGSLSMDGVKLTGNYSEGKNSGGGIYFGQFNGTAILKATTIMNNRNANGGGIYLSQNVQGSVDASDKGNIIANNTASVQGSDIFVNDAGKNGKLTLPKAGDMGSSDGIVYEADNRDQKITGWYNDTESARYIPTVDSTPLDSVTDLGAGTALVASYTITSYNVTNELTNVTNNNSTITVTPNASYSATLTAESGYAIDLESVSVTMGETTVENTVHENQDGTVTIKLDNVTGDVVIKASAVLVPTYDISLEPSILDFGTVTKGYYQPDAQTVTITNTGNQ